MPERLKGARFNRATKFGTNTVGRAVKEMQLVQEFCNGCVSCIPLPDKQLGFPGCKEGVATSNIVLPGTISANEIVPPPNCLSSQNN